MKKDPPTLGILGGGQLARMIALAAHPLGVRPIVLELDRNCPAAAVAEVISLRSWDDLDSVTSFANECDAVTLEFENIPAQVASTVDVVCPLRPGPELLATCQNRIRERKFVESLSLPHPLWFEFKVDGFFPLEFSQSQTSFVVKTASGGYDGKGQWKFNNQSELEAFKEKFPPDIPLIMEEWIENIREFSILVARNSSGNLTIFPPFENIHRNHILDTSTVPAALSETKSNEAREIALNIAKGFALEGLIAVELFLTPSGEWKVNEMAPRPHNSGHLTIEAAEFSQFEIAVRSALNWPLPEQNLLQPSVMINLLGNLWEKGDPPFSKILGVAGAHLHLYGKEEARPGRKMGHITVNGKDREDCEQKIRTIRQILSFDP